MSDDSHDSRHHDDRPETALDEVLREVEEAERPTDAPRTGHRGEAGDAVTPNTQAQEESRGD
ncbi:hypothetical protein ACH4F6_02615 [Streptomyces sp. NPDC017936]|uniref:hypothetical protein n=1 Tax=Streptomyces sp. NPDC017936 TaxID=3365016 RepID=UPI0037BBF001